MIKKEKGKFTTDEVALAAGIAALDKTAQIACFPQEIGGRFFFVVTGQNIDEAFRVFYCPPDAEGKVQVLSSVSLARLAEYQRVLTNAIFRRINILKDNPRADNIIDVARELPGWSREDFAERETRDWKTGEKLSRGKK